MLRKIKGCSIFSTHLCLWPPAISFTCLLLETSSRILFLTALKISSFSSPSLPRPRCASGIVWACRGLPAQHYQGSHLGRQCWLHFMSEISCCAQGWSTAVMILMTFLPLNQMLRAKECISLLPFVISLQQTKVRLCFPVALAETGGSALFTFGGIQLNTGPLSSPPVLPGICGGFGTVSAWGRQPEVRQQRRRWKKWVQSLGLPGTSRLTVIQTLHPLEFQFSVSKPGQTVISSFSVVPRGTVISPKFCGRDEWVGFTQTQQL